MKLDLRKLSCVLLVLLTVPSKTFAHDGGVGESDRDRHDGPRKLRVFDSRGIVVGPLVDAPFSSFSSGALITVNGANVVVPIRRMTDSGGHVSSTQYAWAEGKPWYSTTDCSGPPVIIDTFAVLRPLEVVRRGTDVTAYIASDTDTASVDLRSYSDAKDRCSAYDLPGVGGVWMTGFAYSLTQYFLEPLTVHY
ncbi:hypothetical protein [Caballeronia sp. Sq4a]|uniref:hypothetical protein n=1 Tax=Caballeronia sp. Sq4a TaxID=2878152 RepID=UPI0020BEE7F4|nr:hypothetical protein [Caballeronia sp. Sq4a]